MGDGAQADRMADLERRLETEQEYAAEGWRTNTLHVEQLAAIRNAMGGYPDSDLVSLATTLAARDRKCEVLEVALARAADALDEARQYGRDDLPTAPDGERPVEVRLSNDEANELRAIVLHAFHDLAGAEDRATRNMLARYEALEQRILRAQRNAGGQTA